METFLFEILVELTAYGILKLSGYLIEVVKNNVDENQHYFFNHQSTAILWWFFIFKIPLTIHPKCCCHH